MDNGVPAVTAVLSPLTIQKFFDNNGQPLAKGQLFTYKASTNTKLATYIDSAGGTPNTNPIILDFRGECRLWIDPTLAYQFVLAPSTDTDPPTNPFWSVDNISAFGLGFNFDNSALDIGTVNNIAVSIPAISSPAVFTRIQVKIANTNTGATTISINGGTAKSVTLKNIAALTGGELLASGIYIFIFDGAQWQLESFLGFQRSSLETTNGVMPSSELFIYGDARRYGAVGNGSIIGNTGTDDTAAFVLANTSGHRVSADGGLIYRISGSPTITSGFYVGPGTTLSVDTDATLTLNCIAQINSTVPFYGYGYVAFSTQTRPARLLNLLPDRAAGVPVRGSCQYHAFGDSYTSGTGVTVVTRYPAILASRWNSTENNHGVGGRGVTRANLEAFQNLPKWGSRSMLITWMAGFNDLHYGGSNPKTLVKITSETQAFIANAFLKSAVAADDAAVTKTGVWNNATPGTWADKGSQSLGGHAMYSTVSANKIAWTFTGTNVIVGYWQGNNAVYVQSSFDVYIDSVFVETVSPNNTTDGNAGFPETYEGLTHAVLFYSALGGGSHTIELRQATSNYVMVDYFGTLLNPGDCPSVLLSDIPHVNAAGYAGPESLRTKQIDDAGSAAIRTAVNVFGPLGYPVSIVPVNDYYNYQANIQGDNDHPNVAGHQQIAAAFSAYCFASAYQDLPSCTFTKSATQSIANSTVTAVTFSAAIDDFYGFRDTVNTSRIIAPASGTMRLSGIISCAANATGIRALDLFKNGGGAASANILAWQGFINNDNIFSFSTDIALVAGDYVELKFSQNSGGALNMQTNCRLDVAMIR